MKIIIKYIFFLMEFQYCAPSFEVNVKIMFGLITSKEVIRNRYINSTDKSL